jgi:hypothetical protein
MYRDLLPKPNTTHRDRSRRKLPPTGALDQEWVGHICILYYRESDGFQVRCSCALCGAEHRGQRGATKTTARDSIVDWMTDHRHSYDPPLA